MEKRKKIRTRRGIDHSKIPVVREFSAGGVVFKKEEPNSGRRRRVLWLVTKSTPSELIPKNVWRLPKGHLDDGGKDYDLGPLSSGNVRASEQALRKAALREVEEEGGVKAKIVKKLGTEKFFYNLQGEKRLKFVTFYLMEWTRNLPAGPDFETEEIAWLKYKTARNILKYSGEKKMLDKAHKALQNKNSAKF